MVIGEGADNQRGSRFRCINACKELGLNKKVTTSCAFIEAVDGENVIPLLQKVEVVSQVEILKEDSRVVRDKRSGC